MHEARVVLQIPPVACLEAPVMIEPCFAKLIWWRADGGIRKITVAPAP